MTSSRRREARLRQQYATLYAGITPGEWMSATLMAELVSAMRLGRGRPTVPPSDQALDPEHFDFRYGTSGRTGG